MKKIAICLCVMGLLSGCGVKPSHVDPPPGVKVDTFPKTYPNPATDPQPKKSP
jgi:uncharacterized protein YceK